MGHAVLNYRDPWFSNNYILTNISVFIWLGVQEIEVQNAETNIAEAAQREQEAQSLAHEAEERLKMADSEEAKKAAEEERKQALEAAQKERHIRLKEGLTKAIKSESMSEIESSVVAVRKEKVPDCFELITKVNNSGYFCMSLLSPSCYKYCVRKCS